MEVASEPQYPPIGPTAEQTEECMRALREALLNGKFTPHWPMYVRNVKQFVKNAAPGFDERRFGFANFLEALRGAQRAGLFRLERNRQGILRVFPGNSYPQQERYPGLPADVEESGASDGIAPSDAVSPELGGEELMEDLASMGASQEDLADVGSDAPSVLEAESSVEVEAVAAVPDDAAGEGEEEYGQLAFIGKPEPAKPVRRRRTTAAPRRRSAAAGTPAARRSRKKPEGGDE
jgi:hypothetical protein